jgi:Tfp pilus assembly protein PilF
MWELALDLARPDGDQLERYQDELTAAYPDHQPSDSLRLLSIAAEPDLGTREQALYEEMAGDKKLTALAQTHLGELCLERGNALAAREFLTKASAQLPKYPRVWRALARSMMATGQTSDSEVPWTKYIGLSPKDPDALYQLAWVLINNKGRPRDARPYLDRALRLMPNDVAILLGRGSVALMDEPPDKSTAKDTFERAVLVAPNDPDVRYNLGILYADHLGEPMKAIEQFEAYLTLSREGQERVRQWIEELRMRVPL